MAVLLIRKNSDTPNVRNSDDARMMRYATYGKSGIVKDFGDELALSKSGNNVLHIAAGEIIHQGWQVTVEGAGFDVQLDNRDTVEYYTIYLEISLVIASSQTASILSLKANNTYPEIQAGDDLSENPRGTARLEIARVRLVPSSSTFEITPMLNVIDYEPTYAVDATYAQYASRDTSKGTIEQRLTDLGFKSGSLTISGSGYTSISSPTNSLVKQGQMVRCWSETRMSGTTTSFNLMLGVPSEFKPLYLHKITLAITVNVRVYMESYGEEIIPQAYVNYSDVQIFKEKLLSVSGMISIDYNEIKSVLDNAYQASQSGFLVRVSSFSVKSVEIYTGWKLN